MGKIRSRLSSLTKVTLEKLYRVAPVKLTSWLFFKLGHVVLKKSPLFDRKYYLESNPAVAGSGIDPVTHYLMRGAAAGLDPHPFFDTLFYMSTHPGTASTGINPLLHFLIVGASEKIKPHPLFDTAYYLTENPDVATSRLNPLTHFILSGAKEGRIPDPLLKEADDNSSGKELFDWQIASDRKSFQRNPTQNVRERLLTTRMWRLFQPSETRVAWMSRLSERLRLRPEITIVIFEISNNDDLSNSLLSIINQAYQYWSVVVVDDRSKNISEEAQKLQNIEPSDITRIRFLVQGDLTGSTDWATGDFIAFLKAGDRLLPNALFELIRWVNVDPAVDLVYCDEYRELSERTGKFFFKPGWSPELLFGANYIGDFFLLRKSLLGKVGGILKPFSEAGIYDLLLRISVAKTRCSRVPVPLVHRSFRNLYDSGPEQKALKEALDRRGQPGDVISLQVPGTYRVKLKIAGAPLVSIIIPTAFSNPAENLEPCLRSIFEKTTYQNYEILLMDNSRGKIRDHGLNKFIKSMPKLHVIEHNKPFNYSQVINKAVSAAHGEYLLMMNDDIEVVSPDWIESMLEYAQLDDIGVVGTKLLYPEGWVQHAGGFIVDGQCLTRHAFQYLRDDPESYNGLGSVVRNCSFVTFAAAMIRKDVFIKLGGLDERFDVEYNDSDFCLKAITTGLRVVYTPHAELIHKDARTRSQVKMVKITRNSELFHDKWRNILEGGDPYYNPNLTLETPNYAISDRPVIVEPLWSGKDTLDVRVIEGQGKIPASQIGDRSKVPPVIVIDSTSPDEMRLWPQRHFKRLAGLLSDLLGAAVVVNIDLKDSRSSARDCDLVIGGLNENIIYSASSGIPTLVIWPGQVEWNECGNFGDRAMAIRMAVPCSPCHKKRREECPYDLKCLNMLWPYKVFEAAKELLALCGGL